METAAPIGSQEVLTLSPMVSRESKGYEVTAAKSYHKMPISVQSWVWSTTSWDQMGVKISVT